MYRLKLSFSDEERQRYAKALEPEFRENVGRSTMRMEEGEKGFYIYIEAPDIVSLKASVSSLTRWLVIINRIMEEVN